VSCFGRDFEMDLPPARSSAAVTSFGDHPINVSAIPAATKPRRSGDAKTVGIFVYAIAAFPGVNDAIKVAMIKWRVPTAAPIRGSQIAQCALQPKLCDE